MIIVYVNQNDVLARCGQVEYCTTGNAGNLMKCYIKNVGILLHNFLHLKV